MVLVVSHDHLIILRSPGRVLARQVFGRLKEARKTPFKPYSMGFDFFLDNSTGHRRIILFAIRKLIGRKCESSIFHVISSLQKSTIHMKMRTIIVIWDYNSTLREEALVIQSGSRIWPTELAESTSFLGTVRTHGWAATVFKSGSQYKTSRYD